MHRFIAALFAVALLAVPSAARADVAASCSRLALTLVIDRSGSMTGLKLENAKSAAKAVVDQLGANDCVAVITFDSAPQTIVAMHPVSDAAAIKAAIARVTAGGGTEILSALDAAHKSFTGATASARKKHVVLLTDGMSPIAGLQALVQSMVASHETLTAVGLGTDFDEQTLKMLASTGNGRFYRVADATYLSTVFTREVTFALSP